ncbi:adaptor protein MecA [Fredinandcohnia quinoae]|uniref:Adapter protein MecA n=1 Tax=Fredinandcohnia quinoae TaxID=2918902 RepID=A0AAW5E8I0_9BACI|nr:adaptor protein MecA [Fredinandcohnia sp. SECRCQ15]MCH1626227.1 adaptor protein MecA [Fredinandcohnia sp. SECRCQ15]
MEIERINEHTVKFYISYKDIEQRGFEREEIWYNRERSEELFWEMMDEIHQEEEFTVDGPIWIQVQALEKGLEVLVTRAQLSKDGNKYELPVADDKLQVDEKIESLLEQHFNPKYDDKEFIEEIDEEEDDYQFLIRFNDFEDIISLAHRINLDGISNSLLTFEGKYYLYLEFNEDVYTEDQLENMLSIILEYGQESVLSIHRIEEYGKKVINENALEVLTKHFSLK